MLTDEVIITVKGGNGGNGAISFLRNGQTSRGGPDGGNGGNGGDVYFKVVNDVTLLSQFNFKKKLLAEDGVSGSKQKKHGKNAEDLIILVPVGTEIYDLNTKEKHELNTENELFLIAKGGHGGRGNDEFKTATLQAPKYRELGEQGEEKKLKLELKLIADIGIIGLPNAGKSSLLQSLTNANPKIGDYPFTTLEPNLGVLGKLIIADIPGLIEGASMGKGLGDKFLKHIEKTKILIHCIDATSEDLKKDYKVIKNELESFNKDLFKKNELLILTKIDLIDENDLKKKITIAKRLNKNFIAITILDDAQVNKLKNILSNY